MTKQIHGHEVMEMMLTSDQSYTRETLCDAIEAHFGGEARFYTCSDENMTAKELVSFLESRGKFVAKGSGFNTRSDKICSH